MTETSEGVGCRLSSPLRSGSKGHLSCPSSFRRAKALPLDPRYGEGLLACSAIPRWTKAPPSLHRYLGGSGDCARARTYPRRDADPGARREGGCSGKPGIFELYVVGQDPSTVQLDSCYRDEPHRHGGSSVSLQRENEDNTCMHGSGAGSLTSSAALRTSIL